MSRCGSCPLYGPNPECEGNLPAQQCATVLQEKIIDLQYEIERLRKEMPARGVVNQFKLAVEMELKKLSPPEKPDCYPKGEWNRIIYGYDGNRVIYVDGKPMQISESTFEILDHYANAYRKYEKQIQDIKAGVGIHKDGICPVCGEKYERFNINPISKQSVHHLGQKWHCPQCGCTGKDVHNSFLARAVDVVDGNGNPMTVDPADIEGYICPYCFKDLTDEELHPDGNNVYWRCGGSYGIGGCLTTGRFVIEHRFRHHINVRTKEETLLWGWSLG